MRLAVLASHEGTTLQCVIDACATDTLRAQVVAVISNNSNSGAIRRAHLAGILTHHISSKTHPLPELADDAVLAALRQTKADWVLLLGYMKKLGRNTLSEFGGRILNTHPALLPKFGGQGLFGRKVHEAVLDAGETESGATIHLVDAEYDTGQLISQVKVPVLDSDTVEALEERVKKAERRLLIG
ncbi:MAG: phosphoribosylglycinamide formyltransferase, partial [Gammaproteobacteria bacterium]|nr:phosphoribosylglycinamide formyltransferase [Gammaproteobacteria bacterium]